MKRIIRLYLYFLPFYSLVGIIISIFRTAYQENNAQVYLLIGALLDLVIVIVGRKHILNKTTSFILILLIISCITGLFNGNELSRRYLTDFTNPFFFFSKIFIFAAYWKEMNFESFINYYKKVAFYGSLVLLPLTYALFRSAGVTRLSIFPPMELPFALFMQQGGLLFLLSLIIILLYGKRAQFISAIFTFFVFIIAFKKKHLLKYILITLIGGVLINYMFVNFNDNVAVSRLIGTVEKFNESEGSIGAAEDVGGSRAVEVELILKDMTGGLDYLLGKGLGYTYTFEFNNISKVNANAHFTPVAFLSKYGVIFTIFIYYFMLSIIFKRRNLVFSVNYITAIGTCLFVFFESFFAYAIFVIPIFPVAFGYMLYVQKSTLKRRRV